MAHKLNIRWVLALVAALVLAAGVAEQASAADGPGRRPGKGPQKVAVAGIIEAITSGDEGTVLTLKPREGENVDVLITGDTRVVPPGAQPVVGMRAHGIAQPPETVGDPLVAISLQLSGPPNPPGRPTDVPGRHGCGVIAELPSPDVHDGLWTIATSDTESITLIVTSDTKIAPADAEPAVGDKACFAAREVEEGWLAHVIQLEPRHARPGPGPRERLVVVHGKVTGLPDDRSGEWTLNVTTPAGDVKSLLVKPDTVVHGELAELAPVVVIARIVTDAAGAETLVALKIAVVTAVPPKPQPPERPRAVRFEGTVTDAPEGTRLGAWTIETADGPITLTVDEKTRITGLTEGESPAGREVHGKATRLDDGSLIARTICAKTE